MNFFQCSRSWVDAPPARHRSRIGNPNDDVAAQLVLGHYTGMQPGQTVIFGQIKHGNDYLGAIPLGGVSGGTPVIATLAWDQPNHQFVANWIDPATNVKTETTMPYTFADTTPAANPSKDLSVNTFPANCTASPSREPKAQSQEPYFLSGGVSFFESSGFDWSG